MTRDATKYLALICSAIGVTVVAYSGWRADYYWQTAVRVGLYAVIPAGVVLLALSTLAMTVSRRATVLVNLVAVMAAALAAEAALQLRLFEPRAPAATTVPTIPPAPDPAYSVLCGYLFLSGGRLPVPMIDGSPLLPVGGLAGAPIRWYEHGVASGILTLDEQGFHNPPGSWRERPVAAMAVGDSYTFGLEVAPGKGFVDLLRPFLGPTVNLGCNGNGPLLNLASLREYGPVLKPRTVLWFHYEGNDLNVNLPEELANPLLRAYLDGGTQHLHARAEAKDAAWLSVLPPPRPPGEGDAPRHEPAAPRLSVKTLLGLGALRTAAGLALDFDPAVLPSFEHILRLARADSAAWGGRLVLVYLPAEVRHLNAVARWDADGYKAKVLEIARRLSIPTIDVTQAFDRRPDARRLYHGHYTAEGYALVAATVREGLEKLSDGR